MKSSYQVSVSAEAFAAAMFSQAGCDVLVQYGANQPEFDLAVTRGGPTVKVSVKGSQDGGWVMTARQKEAGISYHQAIGRWVKRHKDRSVIYCFVQFKGVPFASMPRLYLASIREVSEYLKASRGGLGYTSLRECYVWKRGKAKGTTDNIPIHWQMTKDRIRRLVHGR